VDPDGLGREFLFTELAQVGALSAEQCLVLAVAFGEGIDHLFIVLSCLL